MAQVALQRKPIEALTVQQADGTLVKACWQDLPFHVERSGAFQHWYTT